VNIPFENPCSAEGVAWLQGIALSFDDNAYDHTTAEECAVWLHAADLTRQLSNALGRIVAARVQA
jgi:hypothetical protein